jgi:hypothetical protein
MNPQPYIIGSGYHWEFSRGADTFFRTWVENIAKLNPAPEKIIIITDSGARPPIDSCMIPASLPVQAVYLNGDLGSCHALMHGIKKHAFAGWTGAVCAAAMIAYCDEKDFLFFEQDVLAFGPIIEQMYAEIKGAGIIFGKCDWMPCEQSLFLVRHHYIPDFVRLFLGEGPQYLEENLGEHIFLRLAREHTKDWFQFEIQYGRNRPINFDDPIFYAQKWTPQEMEELRNRKLI